MTSTLSKHIVFTLLVFELLTGLAYGGAIHDAAQAGDVAHVRLLLKNDPNLVSSKDSNPDGYLRDTRLGRDWTPLHVAAAYGRLDVAKLLIADKADVNARDREGWTPLMWSAAGGYKEIAELLVASGADVNATNKDGRAALAYTASMNHKDVAIFLLAHKADINRGDKSGGTPLQFAAINGNKDMAEFLLANGANVNSQDCFGDTPLHAAASLWTLDSLDILKLLVENHADINVTNKVGLTPIALSPPGSEAANFLRQHGGH